jgi:hypothetical protein
MKNKLEQSSVDQIVRATNEKKNIFGAVFYISSEDNSIDLMSASGNIAPENPYYIASINKMFISSQAVEKVTLELTCSGFGLDAPINDAFITQPGLIKVKF